ncbi:MAG: carboxypeptidase regulatory-like domain-containing protein, partial [Candidatus Eremiobacteraeota bacterium]|nr:carboxypeptidase regulatory-like domain-containing protein [Candidatus Eremiobacteraeota bacterium]
MKRPLVVAAAVLLAWPAAWRAEAQVPMTVGSVRDQEGRAVEGAAISVERSSGPRTSTTTDSTGTFALHVAGVTRLRVTCRYCAPVSVEVHEGQPVVALVRRYVALTERAPSPSDLENLPYAHVESAVGLRPFTLVAQSSSPYPGTTLSDR